MSVWKQIIIKVSVADFIFREITVLFSILFSTPLDQNTCNMRIILSETSYFSMEMWHGDNIQTIKE